MKYLKVLILALVCWSCNAQTDNSNLLISKTKFTNYAKLPFYKKLITTNNGATVWKDQYKYLDSIDIYSIKYKSDNLIVTGLMVTPKATGKYPSIIFNRGGNQDFGKLVMGHAIYTFGELAKEGYVVIASNYRGNGGSEGKEEFGGKDVNDVINLIDALKEVEQADTDNIGMYGWSRGGMMTYRALTQTNKIKAAVVGGAISDQFESIKDRPKMETGVLAQLVPNYYDNKEAELTKRSAVKWADQFPKDTPILLLHGTSDWRVKPEHSLKMALEFEKHRIPYRLIMFEGGDHGITEHKDEVNQQVLNWFNKYLKHNQPLPNMEYHGK